MYKLAIIGCGRISNKHVQAVSNCCDKIQIVAVCDIIISNAELRADQYSNVIDDFDRPKVYTDYKEMIQNEAIDIVSICTESGYHAEQAIYCINKGKHVIVEKPMALSTKDAEDMINAASQNSVKLCVSHQNRFNPPVQKLRQALEEGRFGRIIAGNARILWNRQKNYYEQAPWRGTYHMDGGCLMNQCIHNIDLLQWMLGEEVNWLNSEMTNVIHPYIEAEDYGSIQIKFKNGSIGNVEGTVCVYPVNLEETLTIIGENGTAVIGGLAVNKIEVWRFKDGLDDENEMKQKYNSVIDSVYGNGHILLYRDVIDAIENDRKPYIDGPAGKKALEIILASYKSSKEGRRISFPIDVISTLDFNRYDIEYG